MSNNDWYHMYLTRCLRDVRSDIYICVVGVVDTVSAKDLYKHIYAFAGIHTYMHIFIYLASELMFVLYTARLDPGHVCTQLCFVCFTFFSQ